ncbi:DUF5995 family protein [Streptomyces sp. HNM0574]|uniref:DUF5995 family protein n=1 Tax=Streptomyces sp. HNM0574 TaxID=2714954 RepID=UPI00146CB23A|nr:DUF5995 family protein [Streptomyces sp. HNM0574]NLU70682.1 hypothetical protein [Streptomyces sp. HNM0574]
MTAVERTPAHGAASLDLVLQRMRTAGTRLPPGDGVAAFHHVYLPAAEEWAARLGPGRSADRALAAELLARLTGRYLDAVDAERAGRRPPACWRPLFQLRRHPSVHVLQFALSGINAHTGHDLPLALAGTCRARRLEPEALEGGFDLVGELLTGLEERIREDLMPGPDLLDVADPLTHLLGSWSLEMARAGAWAAFRALWGLRELPGLAEEFTERLDGTLGLAGRCLLTPLPD